ncbi:C40 family peptidase [Sporosarcina sp. OR05]|uniref:C40 family peptidase n=1 Tax=Sporosarcina sp. OR05 TaxID=2969819 RepID=UPI00352ACBEC
MKRQLLSAALVTCLSVSSFAVPALDQTTTVSAATLTTQASQQTVNAKADQLINTAKSLIGKATYSTAVYKPTYPYKFSCATFLMYVFEENGVDLATYNENYMMQQGTPVAKGQWQKGDLLFFKSKTTGTDPDHVAMYIGDNKVIHMADSKQNIVISDMDSKPYYTETYMGARRVIPSLLPANPATTGDKVVSLAYDLKDTATIGSVNNESAKKFTSTGFVNYVYKKNGVNLNATNLKTLQAKGTTVSRSNLQKGDLVFFNSVKGSTNPSLVGIYAGEHRVVIPNSGGVISRVLLVDYYNDHYITAKRVVTNQMDTTPTKPTPPSTSATSADKVVNFATSLTGKAKFGYVYDEKSLTFTGAGFTYYVYKKQGIDLTYKMASQQAKVGTAVAKSNLQKGDVLFFSTDNKRTRITQTGIYMGGNQFISLSTSGTVVKQSLSSTWAKLNYVQARRVLSK